MLLGGFFDTIPSTAYGQKEIRQAAKELLVAGRRTFGSRQNICTSHFLPHSICCRRTTRMLFVTVQEQLSLPHPVAHWGRLTLEEVYMDEHSQMYDWHEARIFRAERKSDISTSCCEASTPLPAIKTNVYNYFWNHSDSKILKYGHRHLDVVLILKKTYSCLIKLHRLNNQSIRQHNSGQLLWGE